LQAIVALGDLSMNCGQSFTHNYLEEVLKILESAAKQSLQVQAFNDDEEMISYLKQLRETIVECYTSIVHGVTTSQYTQDKNPLIKYAPALLSFLAQSADKSYAPSKVSLITL
jgi:hypothetical protein